MNPRPNTWMVTVDTIRGKPHSQSARQGALSAMLMLRAACAMLMQTFLYTPGPRRERQQVDWAGIRLRLGRPGPEFNHSFLRTALCDTSSKSVHTFLIGGGFHLPVSASACDE